MICKKIVTEEKKMNKKKLRKLIIIMCIDNSDSVTFSAIC